MTILDMSDLFCLSTTLPITPHTKCTTSKQTSDVIKRLHSKIPMTILVKKRFHLKSGNMMFFSFYLCCDRKMKIGNQMWLYIEVQNVKVA